MVTTPLSIVWPCALDVRAYAAAGQRVEVPAAACPDCGRRLVGWSGYWRWVRARGGEQRVWVRRAPLPGVPAQPRAGARLRGRAAAGRGRDDRAGAGAGGERAGAADGRAAVDVPYTTARSWWRRFRARAPTLTAALVALAVGLDGAPVDLAADGAAAALAALAVAWGRARARWGERVGPVWRFWSRVTGGRALATTTSAPLAGTGAAAWMAPSR